MFNLFIDSEENINKLAESIIKGLSCTPFVLNEQELRLLQDRPVRNTICSEINGFELIKNKKHDLLYMTDKLSLKKVKFSRPWIKNPERITVPTKIVVKNSLGSNEKKCDDINFDVDYLIAYQTENINKCGLFTMGILGKNTIRDFATYKPKAGQWVIFPQKEQYLVYKKYQTSEFTDDHNMNEKFLSGLDEAFKKCIDHSRKIYMKVII